MLALDHTEIIMPLPCNLPMALTGSNTKCMDIHCIGESLYYFV